jgi:hypothetical protein
MSGAYQFPVCRRSTTAASLVLLTLFAAGGCKKQPEITRYQVPKETPSAGAPVPSQGNAEKAPPKTPGQDRMLAAIVPRKDAVWFFKLAGDGQLVEKLTEDFETFVKSVTFPESSGGKPEWKLPADWKQQPRQGIRFATLMIPVEDAGKSQQLELSVITLPPWDASNEKAAVLSNVNRWRDQMQLPPLAEDKLDSETSKLKLAEGEAILANLKGTYTESMAPRFANPPGGTEN